MRKEKKTHGAKLGKYGGSGKTVALHVRLGQEQGRCAGALSCSSSHFFVRQRSGRLRRIE